VKKSESKRAELDVYKSYMKIYPDEHDTEAADLGHLLETMRAVFYSLCSIKTSAFIASSNFEKLMNAPNLKSLKFSRTDL